MAVDGFGDRRKEILEDIAILTGGIVISEEKGLSLEQATIEMLGRCDKVTVSKESAHLIPTLGQGEGAAIGCYGLGQATNHLNIGRIILEGILHIHIVGLTIAIHFKA